ncbi:hypothetical protein DOC41_24290 [Salmonella enterica subsp. enterica serovar Manhattan]|nr:hypothetical protein [Salmonella enterica subsp. enterica serovar Manhattan]EBU8490552.1 hypothetical protein [Salmonella enterica subsp. enterica serovar Manhattan]EBU8724789.1 hypothetical protein [Salmonella enterica subsp. enterica serovar Manhattan]EBV3525230.1 hypothetical protein [Salmonella enterica subsp. enterica serovar Manhattan]EBX6960635.1 hypothetical protein [Salmonella enterica subsp. enterica serovar Manhattan]
MRATPPQGGWIVNMYLSCMSSVFRASIKIQGCKYFFSGILFLLLSAPAGADTTAVSLSCGKSGRVQFILADYGLVTEFRTPHQFYVGSGQHQIHLLSGEKVTEWIFSNNDRVFHEDKTSRWFVHWRQDNQKSIRGCIVLSQKKILPQAPEYMSGRKHR